MKFRNQFFKYMSPEQGGEQGGGAGDGSNADNGSTGEGDGSSDGGKGSAEEGGKGSEDNTLLREIMKKKGKIQELEGKLESYADIDVDLYKTMLSERETAESERKKAEQQRLLDEGKYEELLKGKQDEHDGIVNQMNTAHKTELDEAATNYSKLEDANKALVAQIEELTVGAAFGNSTLIREDMISAMTPARVRTLYGAHFEPNENGEVIGYDKPTGVEGRAQS
ncbi:hypothetical protein JCM19235_1255 [Vibrio maritimus]|uniref:Uncharacterized protein n=1 Tax=Vibrio maritimus TaxID=990268 RepID=A0A090S8V7_9VIBR|nr:hypothetical protein JCM19235_1255 [Vibrio maritimus]